MDNKMLMKAPEGTRGQAIIEGHSYDIPKTGVIEVAQESHIDTLRRHGFTEHYEQLVDAEAAIDAMDDRDELVTFIEEHGGDADNDMSLKKLRRLAKSSLGE